MYCGLSYVSLSVPFQCLQVAEQYFCDMDVLYDYVFHSVCHTKAFAADNALGADADDTLVGSNVNASNTSSIIGNTDGGDASTCIAVRAP